MSGPKGFGYRVVSAVELRRREDKARSLRCDQYVRKLADLVAQLRRFGAPSPRSVCKPASNTHESLITWESDLRGAIRETQVQVRKEAAKVIRRRLKRGSEEVGRRVEEEAARETMRRLDAAKEAVDVSGVSLGGPPAHARAASTPPARSTEIERVSADVDNVVEQVATLRDAAVRDELTRMAERVLQIASPAQAKGDLLTLKTKISNALRLQECRDLAEHALLEIAHVSSPEADALRASAAAVTSTKDVVEIQTAAAALVDTAEKATDVEFVEAALEDALKELGFSIGEGFEVADFGRSFAIADHPDHAGYGVRVQLNPENDMIYTRVVAKRDTSTGDDVRAEEETCAKVHALAERLQRHGVVAELKSERQPGEAPVERYGAKPAGTRPKRLRALSAQQTNTTR